MLTLLALGLAGPAAVLHQQAGLLLGDAPETPAVATPDTSGQGES
ncbi:MULTISPECIES: hypothetical protein [Streptomyces]